MTESGRDLRTCTVAEREVLDMVKCWPSIPATVTYHGEERWSVSTSEDYLLLREFELASGNAADALSDPRSVATRIYGQIHSLWETLEGILITWDHKFSILYGPPISRPPIFFIGLNPGGGPEESLELSWPPEFEYARADYRLARRMRELFDRLGALPVLEKATGANLLFFRTPCLEGNNGGTGWQDVPVTLRKPLEAICREKLMQLIRSMEPRTLFALGMGVFDQLAQEGATDVLAPRGRRLAARGVMDGIPLIAIMHPTGSRWSERDWEDVVAYLSESGVVAGD